MLKNTQNKLHKECFERLYLRCEEWTISKAGCSAICRLRRE
jgi:hypothetical protein